jgi:adenine phosphoribosyltransferase/purine operon repressor
MSNKATPNIKPPQESSIKLYQALNSIFDPLLLERAVQHAVNRFAGARVTKVLSPAVDGIPLAALLADRLGVKLVIAKKTREVGVREFIEEVYVPDKSAMVISLYVPRDALKRGDCVLTVEK